MWRSLIAGLAALAMLAAMPGPAAASEGGKGAESNLVRMSVMVPLIKPGTQDVMRIMPILIDLTADTPEAKDRVVTLMPKLQDTFIGGTYGKVYTNWGYDRIQALIQSLTEGVVGAEFKDHIHVSIRVNVRPQ